MRALLGLAVIALFALAPGCCCSGPMGPHFLRDEAIDGGSDAAFVFPTRDGGRDASHDAHLDGAACVALAPCAPGCALCLPAIGETVQLEFGVPSGSPYDAHHPGYATVTSPADPTLDAPLHLFTPSLCEHACDLDDATSCGSCARCTTRLSQMPLVAEFGGIATAITALAPHTGLCRDRCTLDPVGRGTCPVGTTCDPSDGVCIEACTSDLECNAHAGVTYDGTLVVLQETDPSRVRRCEIATGRCVTDLAMLGALCGASSDCADGALCLEGVCVPRTCADGSCRAACDAATPCDPGLACRAGRCVGACTSDAECVAGEVCAQASFFGMPLPGAPLRCTPSCAPLGARGAAAGCADDAACRAHDLSVGTCEPMGGFCDLDDAAVSASSVRCIGGQICDSLLAGAPTVSLADGHCVDPCGSDADCATLPGFVCVTTGPLTGLCRAPCTSSSACYAGEHCDASLGYCVAD